MKPPLPLGPMVEQQFDHYGKFAVKKMIRPRKVSQSPFYREEAERQQQQSQIVG